MFSYEKLLCALQDGVIWWRIFTSALVKFRTKYRLSDTSGPVSILWSSGFLRLYVRQFQKWVGQCHWPTNILRPVISPQSYVRRVPPIRLKKHGYYWISMENYKLSVYILYISIWNIFSIQYALIPYNLAKIFKTTRWPNLLLIKHSTRKEILNVTSNSGSLCIKIVTRWIFRSKKKEPSKFDTLGTAPSRL
jgi:hypothetical protein